MEAVTSFFVLFYVGTIHELSVKKDNADKYKMALVSHYRFIHVMIKSDFR